MNTSQYVNGYYGFTDTETPQDRESELKRLSGNKFTRIPGSGKGKSFDDLAASIGKRCVRVVDWEGTTKPCSDGAHDGSRMAECTSTFDPGFYAYEETRTPQDREKELMALSGGTLIRLKGASGGTFRQLCERIGRTCKKVVDWEGKKLDCKNDKTKWEPLADDGSRMVQCG